MKLLKCIDGVINFICTTDGRIYYHTGIAPKRKCLVVGDSIYELDKNENELLILKDKVSYIIKANDSWAYVRENNELVVHDPVTDENQEYRELNYYYRLRLKWYDACMLSAQRKDKSLGYQYFFVDSNYNLMELPFYPDLLFKGDGLVFERTSMMMSRRRLDGEILWESEILSHPEELWDNKVLSHSKADETDRYNICVSEKLNRIYVPTASGFLNCLDAETGEIIWETVNYRENGLAFVGRYSIWDKYIYAGGGDRLLEIDAISGECTRILNLKNELWPKLKETFKDEYMFLISGMVHAYEDVIILYTTRPSRIIIIDRESFTMEDNIIILDSVGIPYSTSLRILWHNKKLYLNDTGNKFYVFK